jgi:glycosyltransferase involved in cell wall biosynthesis
MAIRYSIIIPTLNEEKFLPNLLASLAAQTRRNFEVIVVDGSSRDKTVALAKSYAKKLPKLKVIVSKIASLPLQRNLGARRAKGKWLIFIDADGILLPYFVQRCTTFIESAKPTVFTTWFRPDSENPKDAVYTLFANIYLEATIIFKKAHAPGPLTIIQRAAYMKVGGYDERHAFHEDIDFGIRLFREGIRLDILRESLCVWSLRRFRKEGILKVLNQYIVGMLPVLFLNTSFKYMPGYVMGGQLYKKQKNTAKTTIKKFERSFKKLLKELFE